MLYLTRMNRDSVRAEIERLKAEINHHNYLYHVQDNPEISDAEYDRLMQRLLKLESDYPDMVTSDSPTQRVGGEPLTSFSTIKHPVPMLSLANAFIERELDDWYNRIKKLAGNAGFDFVCELKMDGIAVALTYENGRFVTGATRGNGIYGENITHNLRTIHSIPMTVPSKEFARFEARGEVYITKTGFVKLNASRSQQGLPLFANPRNAAAGSLRQLDPRLTASRPLDIYVYMLGYLEGSNAPGTHWERLEHLKSLGFKLNPYNRCASNIDEVKSFYSYFLKERHNLPYEVDGIVVKVNQIDVQQALGNVGREPRWAIAYKFPAVQATTLLKEIKISVGRTGTLNPFAVLEPVQIGGVTVKQATLHNEDDIARKDIREGDTVILQRAGDVIPQIVGPVLSKRPHDSRPFKLSEKLFSPQAGVPVCPECGSAVFKPTGEVMYYCPDAACPAQAEQRIEHFASRNAMDIRGIGEQLSIALFRQGLVNDFADLYYLTKDDLLTLENMGDKSADNLLKSIAGSRQPALERLIYALGIKHVGIETASLLAARFKSLKKIMTATREELASLAGIGPKIAESIVAFFQNNANCQIITKMQKAGVAPVEINEVNDKSRPLSGLEFVITGRLKNYTREEAEEIVRSLGGSAKSDITRKTSYLVTGEGAGSKLDKARQLGIEQIDEQGFLDLLKNQT